MQQLSLGVRLQDRAVFGSYLPGPNALAVSHLRERLLPGAGGTTWLQGPAGSGKSHLLQAACAGAGEAGGAVAYLPLADEGTRHPGLLGGLETLDAVLIDDVDEVIGQADWERALFGLYNELQERGGRLLLAMDLVLDAELLLPVAVRAISRKRRRTSPSHSVPKPLRSTSSW